MTASLALVSRSLRGATTSVAPRAVETAALRARAAARLRSPAFSTLVAGRCRVAGEVARRVVQRGSAEARRLKSHVSLNERDRGVKAPEPPSFAFAFDIDGVLLHVSRPIPGATEVLNFLNANNIPFILLTNGGGKHETERVEHLAKQLGVHLSTDNFVQSHTPFRELLEGPDSLRDKTVLVTGSDYEKCRAIFHEYGFRNVITPADIYAADPTIFPFQTVASARDLKSRPLPKPLYSQTTTTTTTTTTDSLSSHLKIDAMFVLNDPRDWALDIQILTDALLSSRGYLGTYSARNGDASLPNRGWQQDGQPALYFSNADLLWSARHPLPRLGQGAFQAALAGVWARLTGGHGSLTRMSFGKPSGETYRFAERVLARHRAETLASRLGSFCQRDDDGGGGRGGGGDGGLRTVYMVGDNPESDIAGANAFASESGAEWVSVLVRTGVWSPGRGGGGGGGRLEGLYEPRAVVDDVRAAVEWALRREKWAPKEGGESLESEFA